MINDLSAAFVGKKRQETKGETHLIETSIMANIKYFPSSGTTSDVGGIISTTSRKNTWRLIKIEIDSVTWWGNQWETTGLIKYKAGPAPVAVMDVSLLHSVSLLAGNGIYSDYVPDVVVSWPTLRRRCKLIETGAQDPSSFQLGRTGRRRKSANFKWQSEEAEPHLFPAVRWQVEC